MAERKEPTKKETPHQYNDTDTEYTVVHKSYEEGMKIAYDGIKHLTTLNTGALLITLTIFEKMFRAQDTLTELITALCFFVVSILLSSIAMLGIAALVRSGTDLEFRKSRYPVVSLLMEISYVLFILGLGTLAYAVIVNLQTPKP